MIKFLTLKEALLGIGEIHPDPKTYNWRCIVKGYLPEKAHGPARSIFRLVRAKVDAIDYPSVLNVSLGGHDILFESESNLETALIRGIVSENDFAERFAKACIGKVVWDIGAAHGVYSVLAEKSGAKHVYSFEPDPERHAALAKNLNINSAVVAKPLAMGVYDTDGSQSLHTSGRGGHAPRMQRTNGFNASINVPVKRVDTLSSELGCPDIVKIDVEGAEGKVLLGFGETRPSEIFLEAHLIGKESEGLNAYELGFLLGKMGYELQDGFLRGEQLLTHFSYSGK